MATIVGLNVTFTTTAGNKSVVGTPAIKDLIVVATPVAATSLPTVSVSDNNSGGSGTYTKIGEFYDVTPAVYSAFFVRDTFISSATSTTFTATISGDSGGGLSVFQVRGMSFLGSRAVRQFNGESNGAAAGTPTATMSAPVDTANALIGLVTNKTNPATMTARAGFSENEDLGFTVPTSGMETMRRNTGETATAIAWGSTSASTYSCMVIELDAGGLSDRYFAPVPFIQNINHLSPI